jgi:hypothetical protein
LQSQPSQQRLLGQHGVVASGASHGVQRMVSSGTTACSLTVPHRVMAQGQSPTLQHRPVMLQGSAPSTGHAWIMHR